MATSITKEGIQLVKQEVTEVVLDETDNLSSSEEEAATCSPLPTSNGPSGIVSNTTVQVKPNVLENKTLDGLAESSLGSSNKNNDDKFRNKIGSLQKRDGADDVDYDDDEGEGNLMIDDKIDESMAGNNIMITPQNTVEKNSRQDKTNEPRHQESSKADVIILPNSDEQDDAGDIEDDDDSSEKGEKEVTLEKLPRPVNELNCRQSRTYLVKLLRAANGGLNPHYGNPDMKPAFWPDYYWPWAKLTDVHTKPRGMNEPLQYR